MEKKNLHEVFKGANPLGEFKSDQIWNQYKHMKYKTIGEIRYVGSVHQKYVFVNIEH